MTCTRTFLASGLVLAALALGACGLIGSDGAPAPAPTTSTSTTTTTAPPSLSKPEVLDPGAQPRQALRIRYAEGDEATVTFTSDLQITQEAGDRTQRLDSPPIAQTLTYTVDEVREDGAIVTVRIDAIGAKGKGTGLTNKEVAALDDELAPIVGLEATGLATPLGELRGLVFDAPADLPDALAAQLDALQEQLSFLGPALPAEPVGAGATWRTTSTSTVGGAEVQTITTVTVTAVEDGTLRYTSAIETSAEPQAIALTGLAEGTTARLESSDLRGTASGTLALDGIGVTLRTTLGGRQQILLDADGSTTDLTQELEIAYVAVTARD